MIRPMQITHILVVVLLLSACASAPKIETVQDGIAMSYLTVENLADATAIAYQSGVITGDEALEIKTSLQEAKNNLDLARRAVLTDITDAQTGLEKAEAILVTIQKILLEHSQ